MDKDICPVCEKEGVSSWAWLYAHWPVYAQCGACKARFRIKIPMWQLMLSQTAAFFIILGSFIKGISGEVVIASIGFAVGMLIMIIPAYFGRLVEVGLR